MRIGELADRSGVPVKTIRYYEEVGVLAAPPRTPSGYRDYGDETADRLAFVRAAQSVGLTLGEIREIVALRDKGVTPCEHVAGLLQRRAAEIESRIASLQLLRGELGRLARRARSLNPDDCAPDLVCHLITPARHD
ncbi:MAG: heavy metal-responsive transcriptional regulator [Acidimicrobiales bacterium]